MLIFYILLNIFIYVDSESCDSMPEPGSNLRRLSYTDEYCIDGSTNPGYICKANSEGNKCEEVSGGCSDMNKDKCDKYIPTDDLKICAGDGTNSCEERLRTCAEMNPSKCNLFIPTDNTKECRVDQKNSCGEVHKEVSSSNKIEFSKFLSLLLLFL